MRAAAPDRAISVVPRRGLCRGDGNYADGWSLRWAADYKTQATTIHCHLMWDVDLSRARSVLDRRSGHGFWNCVRRLHSPACDGKAVQPGVSGDDSRLHWCWLVSGWLVSRTESTRTRPAAVAMAMWFGRW